MKRYLAPLAGLLLAAAVLIPAAQANVPRYQLQTFTMNLTVSYGGLYTHSYTGSFSPCDGSFSGVGQYPALPAVASIGESISGTLTGTALSFAAVYHTAPYVGYTFGLVTDTFNPATGAFTGTATDTLGRLLPISGSLTFVAATDYKNHGDYVSSQPKGDREDAAHSCIGMPIQAGG